MRKMRKILIYLLLVTMVVQGMPIDRAEAVTEPEMTATSAIIYCGDTDRVIWEKNCDDRMDPASMTKLLTCLLAVENLQLTDEVEVTAEAAALPETKIYLQEGEKITVEELLYGALLASGNDAATALGIAVGGTTEDFAAMMNQKAKELGCTGSNFVNGTGWDDPGHYSTSRDMAIIAEVALSNPTIRKIAGTANYTIPATESYKERKLVNTNYFLKGIEKERNGKVIKVDKYKGVFGGKTGTVGDGKCTMAVGLDVDGLEVYCVIMGSSTVEQRYADMKAVMDYAKTLITKYGAFEKGDQFGKVKLTGGATNKVKAVASHNGYINLPDGASASLVTTECVYTDGLTAPVEKGQKVGVVEVYVADELYKTVDLTAAEAVETGWFLSRYRVTNLQTVIIFAVIGISIVLAIVILYLRKVNKNKAKEARKKRLEEIARREMEREQDRKNRNWNWK